jgi:hypothetical protein
MIDLEVIDGLYDVGIRTLAIFDKRVLLPMSQLPDAVQREAGETLSEVQLRVRAAEGWFPLLKGAGSDGDEDGAPLYAPSRIGMLAKLQRQGWGSEELRLVASTEEWMIDNFLTGDETPYLDDDLETLIRFFLDRIEALEHSNGGDPQEREKELSKARRELELMQALKKNGIPDHRKTIIEKAAFRARALNEFLRLWLLEMDRAKVVAGFSPFISCGSTKWSKEEGFRGEPIEWRYTIKAAMAHADSGVEPPIRIPGLLLRGDQIIPTRTLRPADYASLWKERDLDGYLKCWAELHDERRCLNCFAPLAEGVERKRFCGEKCRNAAKQRRFRERNPESIEQIQKRYWESIDLQ